MIRQDRTQHRAIASSPAANTLFARKGEAVPVGGRSAPRRVITMRPLVAQHEAPIALPRTANTSMPATIERHSAPASSNVLPFISPAMGPAVGDAIIHAAMQTKPRPRTRAGNPIIIRGPVRPAATARQHPTMKRTTLRLDETLRARLARFSASETLSVQALLTRALQRHLPAISVERSTATNLRIPREGRKPAQGGRRSVRFDAHLYWRLKTAAANRRRSMQSIMADALDAYLCELEAAGQAHRASARLSVVA